ncbi:MAG: prepilin-type N-terminal cleavage/methylation domain-containing protein [Nitrospiraceae bacterium]
MKIDISTAGIKATDEIKAAVPKLIMGGRRKKQKGFTLIELTAAVAIIGAVIAAAVGGRHLLTFYNGKSEGDLISNALSCARSTWTSSNFAGITLRNMVDNGCFPVENSSGKGSAAASAANNFSTAYSISAVDLNGTNDGIQVTSTNIPSGSCSASITAANAGASRIQVLAGATTTTVKALGRAINDGSVATACGSATTVSVIAAASKSGG